jgi:hypothetical protein
LLRFARNDALMIGLGRMYRFLFAAVLLWATQANATSRNGDSAPPREIWSNGAIYRLVTGKNLERTLRGHAISNSGFICRSDCMCVSYFLEDGHTLCNSGEDTPAVCDGSYKVTGDFYCMTVAEETFCQALAKHGAGMIRVYLQDGIWRSEGPVTILPRGGTCLKWWPK